MPKQLSEFGQVSIKLGISLECIITFDCIKKLYLQADFKQQKRKTEMCTCYSHMVLRVTDQGQELEVHITLTDMEKLSNVRILCDGLELDSAHDMEDLSDNIMEKIIVAVQKLAADKKLPCHCSGNNGGDYCVCDELSDSFQNPRHERSEP